MLGESVMKLGVIPENLAERLALWFGIPPPGILESWLGIMASRAVMTATKLNIFETLAAGPLTLPEVAEKCGTHGLEPQQPKRMWFGPDLALHIGRKPA